MPAAHAKPETVPPYRLRACGSSAAAGAAPSSVLRVARADAIAALAEPLLARRPPTLRAAVPFSPRQLAFDFHRR